MLNKTHLELILIFISAAVQGRSSPTNLSASEGEGEVETLLRELLGVNDWNKTFFKVSYKDVVCSTQQDNDDKVDGRRSRMLNLVLYHGCGIHYAVIY